MKKLGICAVLLSVAMFVGCPGDKKDNKSTPEKPEVSQQTEGDNAEPEAVKPVVDVPAEDPLPEGLEGFDD